MPTDKPATLSKYCIEELDRVRERISKANQPRTIIGGETQPPLFQFSFHELQRTYTSGLIAHFFATKLATGQHWMVPDVPAQGELQAALNEVCKLIEMVGQSYDPGYEYKIVLRRSKKSY